MVVWGSPKCPPQVNLSLPALPPMHCLLYNISWLFSSLFQMVTRTKKIFVGGLSAPSTLEDVKNYFEQFGRVSIFFIVFQFWWKYKVPDHVYKWIADEIELYTMPWENWAGSVQFIISCNFLVHDVALNVWLYNMQAARWSDDHSWHNRIPLLLLQWKIWRIDPLLV